MRPLTNADRTRVFATLQQLCSTGSVVSMRTRALIALAADSGLRVSECVRLDLVQLLHDHTSNAVRLSEQFWLRPSQAKGGEPGAGMVAVSERARSALREYILALRTAKWVPWPPLATTPLFVGHRGRRGKVGHARLSKRAAQWSWHQVQRRAGLIEVDSEGRIRARYGFHTLRHDAASRLRAAGADAFDLQTQMRWRDLSHALGYIHELDAQRRLPALVTKAGRR